MGVLIGSSSLIESLEFLKCPEFGFFREFDFTNQTFELIQFCFSNWTRFFYSEILRSIFSNLENG